MTLVQSFCFRISHQFILEWNERRTTVVLYNNDAVDT